jgi:hypothetical protein
MFAGSGFCRFARQKLVILHGPENVAGYAEILADAQRSAGLNAISVCYNSQQASPYQHKFGMRGFTLRDILTKISTELEVLHLYFGRSFTGDDLADAHLARRLGKPVFMTLLGCDVRDSKRIYRQGEPTMCTNCWPQGCSISRQATLQLLDTLKTPALVTTPDLALEVKRSIWLPIPIQIAFWQESGQVLRPQNRSLRVLHAPTDQGKKGTIYVSQAIDRLVAQGCQIELVLAQNVTQKELRALALTCDVAIDQVMAGVYGTFGAEMMALGLPVIARISPSLRDAYPDDLPILSAGPETLEQVLLDCLNGKHDLQKIGHAGAAYAKRVHDAHIVAASLSALY